MPSSLLVWSDELLEYNFGASHPMKPIRLELTRQLIADLDIDEGMDITPPPIATDAELTQVHSRGYIDAVKAAEKGVAGPQHGLGDSDNPIFSGMHRAGARLAGATLEAARRVWRGEVPRALSIAGGMHHAMHRRAAGFCVYNDVAVAIADLLEKGARNIVYVDIDAHHGDGVERAFWDDERVLTISLHQHPGTLFPGTGYVQDIGGPRARGSAVNVPLPPGTGDEAWLRALQAIVQPLLRQIEPEVLITQHGCDTHWLDPLAGLELSVDGQREAAMLLAGWAEEYSGGAWVATGGGGYEVFSVVPRAWSHLAAVVAGRPIPPATPLPEQWRAHVAEHGPNLPGETGLHANWPPETMSDGGSAQLLAWDEGFNPADDIDRVIMSVRNAIFPHHGLEPLSA